LRTDEANKSGTDSVAVTVAEVALLAAPALATQQLQTNSSGLMNVERDILKRKQLNEDGEKTWSRVELKKRMSSVRIQSTFHRMGCDLIAGLTFLRSASAARRTLLSGFKTLVNVLTKCWTSPGRDIVTVMRKAYD
jgi:hypothetical protein